jgi:hypothetical protein
LPDIVVVRHGRTIWLEVKRPGGRLTELQAATHGKIRAAGGEVHVVTSLADVQLIMEK